MARDSSWSGFTSSKSDHASFAVQLVMGLIDLIHQLLSTSNRYFDLIIFP